MVVGGDRCIVGSSQGSIYVYSLRKRKLEADLRDHSDSVRCLVFKDNLLVSGGRDLKVQGHDVESGDLLFNLVGACGARMPMFIFFDFRAQLTAFFFFGCLVLSRRP
jgi:WD40 repeat protein